MILDNANLPPVIETAPWMLADGGALDVDRCPDCWERRAHIERYVWAAKVCRHMRVLDFGCGVGYGSEILQLAGNLVVGVDGSAEAVKLASERRPTVRFRDHMIQDKYDACVAFEVLEHLVNPQSFVMALPARHLIASVPVRPTKETNSHHRHDFTIENFRALIETRFAIQSWWLQIEPYHNQPSIMVVHGQERLGVDMKTDREEVRRIGQEVCG